MPLFTKTHHFGETFERIQATKQSIEGITFQNCTFLRCQLAESAFNKCTFKDCSFENSDLSLAKFPKTVFLQTKFSESRLQGINWCLSDWAKRSLLEIHRLDFSDCLLDHGVFIGLNLEKTLFVNCKARGMDFESANLSQADFHFADLEGARFVNCDLTEANFVGAKNYQIDAAQNILHQTRFSLPEAVALLHSLDILLEE